MKNLFSIVLLIMTIQFFSCIGKHNIQYKKFLSSDKAFEVEIPINFSKQNSPMSMMSFTSEKDFAIILIDSLKEKDDFYSFADNSIKKTPNKPHFSSYQKTDSTYFFKADQGKILYFHLFMSKRIDNQNFIISIVSPKLGKKVIEEIIHHIHSSLVSHSIN